MVLLPRNLGTIAVERISGIEPWPRHASRIPLNSFVRFTIRFTFPPVTTTRKVEGTGEVADAMIDTSSLPWEPFVFSPHLFDRQ